MKKRICTFLAAMLFMASSGHAVEKASEERLDEVAQRGAQVMPFDLERTTHVFSKTDRGGVQQVIAKDSADIEQIKLIREHLSKISQAFRQGDFSGPAAIHGKEMPGLAELSAAPQGAIDIAYRELPNGAEIEYSTDDIELVEAVHKWFDAQLSDHARHAVPGHHHNMHRKL